MWSVRRLIYMAGDGVQRWGRGQSLGDTVGNAAVVARVRVECGPAGSAEYGGARGGDTGGVGASRRYIELVAGGRMTSQPKMWSALPADLWHAVGQAIRAGDEGLGRRRFMAA